VSLMKTNRTTDKAAALGDRAKDVAAQVVPVGKRAGSTAAQGVAQGVRKGVHGARGWAAPRLEDAADAVTATVAPKVSSALRNAEAMTTTVAPKVSSALRKTARQIKPDGAKPAKTGFRRLLNWRWLLAAGGLVAAAGTTAAVAMRRRYTSATEEAKEASGPADEATQSPPDTHDGTTHAEVNGRVTTPGR
jgi:hypothetical protein